MMTREQLAKAVAGAVAGALAGAVVGWTGSALALGGRVDAIEHSLARIEAHIDRISIHPPLKVAP